MKRLHLALFFLAALFALAFPALAQTVTITPGGSVSVTCAPTAPPPGPVEPPPPPPPVEPPPPPPAADPCAGMSPRFNEGLARQPPLALWDFMFWMGRGLTDEERACARARGVPGSQPPAPTGNSSTGAATTGFVLDTIGRPLTNTLAAGVPHQYVIPNTAPGARVTLTILEVPGTPDSIQTTSTVRGPAGEILSGPVTFGRHGSHVVERSPGGTLTLTVTPNVTAPLGVQRN